MLTLWDPLVSDETLVALARAGSKDRQMKNLGKRWLLICGSATVVTACSIGSQIGAGNEQVASVNQASGSCPWRSTTPVVVATPFASPNNSLTFTPPNIPCNVFSITSYGAVGDGHTKNTTAFANTVAAAVVAGGGVVDVPSGSWLTGAIHLASNIELHMESGATILFSQTFNDYLPVVLTRWEGLDVYNWSPFIYALNATNVAITGSGTINGQGSAWWSWKDTSAAEDQNVYNYYIAHLNGSGVLNPIPPPPTSGVTGGLRPTMIECNGCTNFMIDGITTSKPGYWSIHPLYSSNVIIRNANITSDPSGSNGDGIDPDSCTNVLITNDTFSTSDDNISMKSGLNEDGIAVNKPDQNIVIQSVTSSTGHGGAVIGSEMSGGVNNVYATNSTFHGDQRPIRVKTLPGRGGTISNVWYNSLQMNWSSVAIEFTTNYGSSTIPPHNPSLLPTLKNVTVENINASGSKSIYNFEGLSAAPFINIVLNNVQLSGANGTCKTAAGIQLQNNTRLTGVPSGDTLLPCN
jgi:polygalacturonase